MADPVIPPDEPTGTPTPQTPSPIDTTAAEKLNSILSEAVGKQGVLADQAAAYAKSVEHLKEQYEEALAMFSSLDQKERSAAYKQLREQRELLSVAERYFVSQKGITAEQEKQSEILKGIQRAGLKMGLDPEQIRATQERAKQDYAISLIDRRITGWTAAAQRMGELVDLSFQSQMAGARGRAVGLMRGAGMAGLEAGPNIGQDAAMRMFGATGSAMGPLERMAAFNKIMMESPRAFEKNEEKMKTFIGTLAYFGATTDQMVSLLIDGSRSANLTTTDIAGAFRSASMMQKDLGLSTNETAANLLNMTKVVRQSGGSLMDASSILSAFSENVKGAGVALAPMEKMALASKFAAGVFSMPVDKLLGLTMFTTGRSLQSIGPGDIGSGNALATVRATFERISQQVGNSYAEQLVATEKTAQLVGINVSNLQEVEALRDILKSSNMDQKEAKRKLEEMSNPALVTARGIENLKETIEPLKSIDNSVKQILSHLTVTGNLMRTAVESLAFLKLIGAPTDRIAGTLLAGMGGAATAKAAAALRTGWTALRSSSAAEGIVLGAEAFAASELAVPALVLGGTIGAVYGINKLHHAMEK